MKTQLTNLKTSLLLLLILLVVSCASVTPMPDLKSQQIDHYSSSIKKNGLEISIHPIVDRGETKKYFGMDLIASKVLPIYVKATNKGTDASYFLIKERIAFKALESNLETAQLSSSTYGDIEDKTDTAKDTLTAGNVLMSLPLILIGGATTANYSKYQHDLIMKELQEKTLSPGKSQAGVIYVKLPDDSKGKHKWMLHLEAFNLQKNSYEKFDLIFDTEIK